MNENYRQALMVLGAYGIVQVLAQDLGIKTGKRQRDLVQMMPVQMILLFAGAFTVTEDINLALIAVAAYYFLKYVFSAGETSEVCFEDV